MPSLVGPINVNSLYSSAVASFGDALILSPKQTGKSYAGSGASSTGDIQTYTNWVNLTNVLDPDGVDEIIIENN